jgi:hypothetical protein
MQRPTGTIVGRIDDDDDDPVVRPGETLRVPFAPAIAASRFSIQLSRNAIESSQTVKTGLVVSDW